MTLSILQSVEREGIRAYVVPPINPMGTILHGFLTRLGGESQGHYSALNLGFRTGDDPAAVRMNFERLSEAYGSAFRPPILLKQVHSAEVLVARGEARPDDFLGTAGDGLILEGRDEKRGHSIGVLTSDCLPMLIADPEGGRIAAIHAGWRGTAKRIAARAVRGLERLGSDPARLRVALGPAIGCCCYEVGPEVAEAICSRTPFSEQALHPSKREGRMMLDLAVANALQLAEEGVPEGSIFRVPKCTVCESAEFYSYRRDGERTGRALSFIQLL